MSRLLQALKNLENRQPGASGFVPAAPEPQPPAEAASPVAARVAQGASEAAAAPAGRGGAGLLAHLADRPHSPSPDRAFAARPAALPTPIEPPAAKSPLTNLSAGVPAAWLAGPPEEMLTAFASLPAMAEEAAALARPAESAVQEAAEAAAERPPPRRSPLDKLSANWPIAEPLSAVPPAAASVAASQPPVEAVPAPALPPVQTQPPVPTQPPVQALAALPKHEPMPASTAPSAIAELTPEPAADPPAAKPRAEEFADQFAERYTKQPVEPFDKSTFGVSTFDQSTAKPPCEPTTVAPVAPVAENAPRAEFARPPAPSSAPSPAPQTLLERTTRRTLADPQRAEPYRQVAERIVRDLAHVAGRSAVLTGVGPASETSELVFTAAAALESTGGQILVIDGDTAHRSLTTQLELSDDVGLAELLKRREEPAKYIRQLSLGGLSFLPIGKGRFPEPESAASQLAALVQSLEAEYSLVLIDGGRTSELAAATLARLADATYFVIRLGHTEASVAQHALRDFRAAGARVLGCVATS